MCLLTTRIVKKIGYVVLLVGSYAGLCIFLLAHLYPLVYILLPGILNTSLLIVKKKLCFSATTQFDLFVLLKDI